MNIVSKTGLVMALVMSLCGAGPSVENSDLGASHTNFASSLTAITPTVAAMPTSPKHQPQNVSMAISPTMTQPGKTLIMTGAMPLDPSVSSLPAAYSRPMTQSNTGHRSIPNPNISAFGMPCTPVLNIAQAPNDLLSVRFQAPCAGLQNMTLIQGKMALEFTTDSFGNFSTQIPHLEKMVHVSVTNDHQTLARASIRLDHTPKNEAYVLIWSGKPPLDLFVRSQDAILQRDATKLGVIFNDKTPTNLVHFTAPERFRSIRLSLVGTVDAQNCGQTAKAHLLHRTASGIEGSDLRFVMPACDQIGKLLELRSVIPDMKMARN